uniref:Uncharacterized protein n=1 Tax=Anguilla anguilla TaxID=7936 RepID=A0A0E9PYB5_ANGAN
MIHLLSDVMEIGSSRMNLEMDRQILSGICTKKFVPNSSRTLHPATRQQPLTHCLCNQSIHQ